MRLKLEHSKGISVLDVLEDVDAHHVNVLKAGLIKLLQSGKNQIILNLIDTKKLPVDVMKNIISFHSLAAELGGQIVLVGQGQLVKEALKMFQGQVPPIKYFSTLEAATNGIKEDIDAKKKSESNASEEELKAMLEKLKAENAQLKTKAQGRNTNSVKGVVKENKELQARIKILEEHVAQLTKESKKPYENKEVFAKVVEIENALIQTLSGQGLVKK